MHYRPYRLVSSCILERPDTVRGRDDAPCMGSAQTAVSSRRTIPRPVTPETVRRRICPFEMDWSRHSTLFVLRIRRRFIGGRRSALIVR